MPVPTPDLTAFRFTLPEARYGFLAATRTFWGARQHGDPSTGPFGGGTASIVARMDDLGKVLSGNVLLTGGLPAQSIPDGSLLVEGPITEVKFQSSGTQYSVSFLFNMTYSHPSLAYQSPMGVWNASFLVSGVTPRNLFRVNWGPASAPLNSYIGQVKDLF